ncbi:MAG: sugar ABC transporter permease [Anaerocolumna sp.]
MKQDRRKLGIAAVLLIMPITIYIAFFIYPMIYTMFLSGYSWNGIERVEKIFVGLKNYKVLFAQKVFYHSLWNALVFIIVSLLIIFPISFSLALLVSKKNKVNGVLRTIFYIPTLLPMTATGLMWTFLLTKNGGAINAIVEFFGMEGQEWLGNTTNAIWVVALVNAWMFVGSNMLVFITGLTGVPRDMIEASVVDGATGFQRIIHIIIPNMKETFKVFLTSAIAGSIKVFDIIYVMTDGGPGTATDVPATLMYDQAFIYSKFGYGSTIGVIILILALIITFSLNHLLDDKEEKPLRRKKVKQCI